MSGAADIHRARLLEGMAEAITEKGYVATTIAEIVRRARVSKRTFYEHFADKEEAFLALYSALSDQTLAAIAEAAAGDAPWGERVDASVRAYLELLAEQPVLTRTFLAEIQAAGPRAVAARRDVMRRFAAGLQLIVTEVREDDPTAPELPDAMATAIVGGINELILDAVEAGRTERLTELADTASALIRAVLAGPPERRGSA